MEPFFNKIYKLEKSENFKELLKSLGLIAEPKMFSRSETDFRWRLPHPGKENSDIIKAQSVDIEECKWNFCIYILNWSNKHKNDFHARNWIWGAINAWWNMSEHDNV